MRFNSHHSSPHHPHARLPVQLCFIVYLCYVQRIMTSSQETKEPNRVVSLGPSKEKRSIEGKLRSGVLFRPEGPNPDLCRKILGIWLREGIEPIFLSSTFRTFIAEKLLEITTRRGMGDFIQNPAFYSDPKVQLERITRWNEWNSQSLPYLAASAHNQGDDNLYNILATWLLIKGTTPQLKEFKRYFGTGLPEVIVDHGDGNWTSIPTPTETAIIPTVAAQVFALWTLSAIGRRQNKGFDKKTLLRLVTHKKSAGKWVMHENEIRKRNKAIRDAYLKLGLE